MKTKTLTVALFFCALCIVKTQKENEQIIQIDLLGKNEVVFEAKITPPILLPPPPKSMYEEPISSMTESNIYA